MTLRAVAHQAPLSMGFTRQEYLSGLPLPSPGDLSDPGIKPMFSALTGGFLATEPPEKPLFGAVISEIALNIFVSVGTCFHFS